jgi:hypothetical protein
MLEAVVVEATTIQKVAEVAAVELVLMETHLLVLRLEQQELLI